MWLKVDDKFAPTGIITSIDGSSEGVTMGFQLRCGTDQCQ